ncbi:MAG: phage shock protein operon transcriptional activator [Pseudomonadota bacterium]
MTAIATPPELIGAAPAFLDALAHASAAAALDRAILICGERGSGKELIAARVHFLSPRWEGPFVKVNCAALSEDLLDSELFGHEAGAFTGATKRRPGRFERADGGTLFLDEIPSASLRVQEKLLRVIEYGEFERIGGSETLTTDARVVAAANVDLPALAARGAFRADLLDRLSFDVIAAPPLRARRDDIPLLAAHFAAGLAAEIGAQHPGFTPQAMAQLVEHNWPGNVRELKNVAERSAYRWRTAEREGPIDEIILDPFATTKLPTDLNNAVSSQKENSEDPPSTTAAHEPASAPAVTDLREHLNEIERRAVEEALARANGSQKHAAEALGLNYNQIRGLVRKHQLSG